MSLTARRAGVFVALAGALAISCGKSATQPSPAPCTFTLSVSSFTFGAAGGSGIVTVSTASTCAWTARAEAAWLSIVGTSSGTGSGAVSFTASPNPETATRSGSLTVADHVVTVAQEGLSTCAYEISPSSAIHTKDAGTGSFTITAGAGCAWTASSSAPWLVLGPGSSQGAGSGTVSYTVTRNADVAGRTGFIAIAGHIFSVTQSGDLGMCQYAVGAVEFTPCMPAAKMSTSIATAAGCPWTAGTDAAWITLQGQSGSGPGSITFSVTDNWDAPRSGVVQVRWPTPTAGQNLHVSQAGCRYAVSTTSLSFAAAGGTGTFDVIQQSDPTNCGGPLQNGCMWTAQADASWITVTSGMPRYGDDRVSFTVAPNTGAASRSGTITVRDKTVRITQAGA